MWPVSRAASQMSMSTGATFSKLLRKILGTLPVLGKSYENIYQSTYLELGYNKAIIIVINTYFCVMLDVITRRC